MVRGWLGASAGAIALIGLLLLFKANQIRSPAQSSPSVSDTAESLQSQIDLAFRWIVSATEARDLAQNGATILDVRSRRWTKIPGASVVTWQEFSQAQAPDRGKLKSDDAALTQQLQALGVSSQIPVLVVGEPRAGWGEAGRLVWMLRTLGHQQSYMVDGGASVLMPVKRSSEEISRGNFIVQRDPRWTIDQSSLKAQLQSNTLQVIDSRERQEYIGNTPYGETRGGHLEGAQHLYFKDLLDANGFLLPHSTLIEKLDSLDIQPTKPIVVYCTGGIRSGWLTTVWVSLGYPAQNYPGSMWEWSALPAEQYPLTQIIGAGRAIPNP